MRIVESWRIDEMDIFVFPGKSIVINLCSAYVAVSVDRENDPVPYMILKTRQF